MTQRTARVVPPRLALTSAFRCQVTLDGSADSEKSIGHGSTIALTADTAVRGVSGHFRFATSGLWEEKTRRSTMQASSIWGGNKRAQSTPWFQMFVVKLNQG